MKKQLFILSVLSVCILSIPCFADNYVIINQVMYDTPLNEQTNISPASNGEYIELYNAGSDTVSLLGWQITGDGTTEKYTFSDIKIPNGEYLIMACKRGSSNTFQLTDLYTLPNSTNYSVKYQNKITLKNDGETITLINAQNDTVDQMHYDGDYHLSDPHLLHAHNNDNTPGDSCVSLHRTWVEFDPEGKVIPGTSQWVTERVSFATTMLPYETYQEDFITGDQPLPAGENYVLSVTPLDPTSRISFQNGQLSVCSGVRTRTELQYMDGLGRTDEVIALARTPGKNDLIAVTEFYGKNKIACQWLPVVWDTDGQKIDIADVQLQAYTDYDDSRPYSETQYENSTRKRPVMQIRPGESYASHGAELTYGLNESNKVRIYTVSTDSILHTDGAFYEAGTLYKNTAYDEEHKPVITYTDKQGCTIMEERDGESTYYVYDELGRLVFVLPNLPSTKLNNGNYPSNQSFLKATAYHYRYDSLGNMIYKRLPGCEPQLMVYDQAGQLVLKQDGNQRKENKWTMCAYDSIGRFVYIAEIKQTENHKQLVDFFSDKWQVEHYGGNQTNAISNTGYASTLLGNNLRPLVVYYYDNHEYLSDLTAIEKKALLYVRETGYGTQYDNITGLLTGTRVYYLSEEGCYTAASYYYDVQGRVVQQRSIRSNDGYKTATSTKYLFDGSVAKQLIVQGTDSDYVSERYRYTYDHAGRTKQVHYQLNDDAEIKISELSYDSIGRLAQNLLHNSVDTERYSYDIRNMLTETHNKHFSERLYYADNLPDGANPCRNGNIAAIHTAYADSADTFAYTYDGQNRLRTSKRLVGYGSFNSELFDYDDAGNLSSLKRFKDLKLIDDLTYRYTENNEGHQLLSVRDDGEDADRYDIIEYPNGGVLTDTLMRYDANGNMVCDAVRGISAIKYNVLNLPDTIQFVNGGQIVNFYDAAGYKYKSITYTNIASVIPQQYDFAHYSFEADSIEYLVTEYTGNIEKLYSKRDTTIRIHNAIGYYSDSTYYHYIKDHLGNVCAVINSERDSVVQSTMYYASGVPMAHSLARDEQPYLYNGKELVEAHGLNTYDYGFRGYYATIGRFTSIDPLAEQTPWQSPYAYAGNNFINAIDWMGLRGMYGGMTGFSHSPDICQYIVIDPGGNYQGGVDDDDNSIYIAEGGWKPENGKEGLERVGRMLLPFWVYENWIGKGNKAPGFYYKNNYSISISGSIGFQAALPGWKGDIGVSLPAWDIFETSYAWNDGFDLNYFGKDGKANISLDVDYLGLKYNYSLQYKIKSGYPVPGTFINGFSYQPNQYLNFDASSSGHMSLTFSFGIGIVCSITIFGDFYYE